MSLQIIFKDVPGNCESQAYIETQPEWQRPILAQFVEELLKKQKIDHPDARKIDDSTWSLWVRNQNGEAVNHICSIARADEPILSDFARSLLDPNLKPVRPITKSNLKRLVILNNHAATAAGKADPYFDPEYFASLMDGLQRGVFLEVMEDILAGRLTGDFTVNSDGSVAIHIERPHLGYGFRIHCVAQWI